MILVPVEDPPEACRAVVAESYELWLKYELRTDDITMIFVFVDGVVPTKELDGADQVDQVANSLGGFNLGREKSRMTAS